MVAVGQLVYSAWVRKVDPPQFVSEDVEYLDGLVGGFVGLEQCDGCGNSVYRVEGARGKYYAVCAVDPGGYAEFAHPDPCGARYPITLRVESEVQF